MVFVSKNSKVSGSKNVRSFEEEDEYYGLRKPKIRVPPPVSNKVLLARKRREEAEKVAKDLEEKAKEAERVKEEERLARIRKFDLFDIDDEVEIKYVKEEIPKHQFVSPEFIKVKNKAKATHFNQILEEERVKNPKMSDKSANRVAEMRAAAKKQRKDAERLEKRQSSKQHDLDIRNKRSIKFEERDIPESLPIGSTGAKLSRRLRKEANLQFVKSFVANKEEDVKRKYTRNEVMNFREKIKQDRLLKKHGKIAKVECASDDSIYSIYMEEAWNERLNVVQFRLHEIVKYYGVSTVTTESLQIFSPLTSQMSRLFGSANVEFGEWLFDFVDMLQMVLHEDLSISQKQRYLTMWLRVQGFRTIEARAVSAFISLLFSTSKKNVSAQVEALSEEIDKVGDVLEYVFDSSFADSVKNLFISAALMKFFNKDTASDIFKYFGNFPNKMPFYDLMRICIKSLARVVEVFENVAAGEPLCEAMFKKDPMVHAKCKFAELKFKRDHLYMGLPVEGKFPKAIWMKECDETLTYLKKRLSMTSSLKQKLYMDLSSMVTELQEMKSTIIATMNAGFRPAPFNILIGEKPGIGKSNLVILCAYIYCQMKGYTFSHDLIYHIDPTSEYHEGLENQIIYHFTEPGTQAKKLAESKGDPKLMEMTSVMDSLAKRANMAELGKKANTFFTPEFVIADTNNMGMNLKHMVVNVAAFRRRFWYVKFEVLERYRKDGSCEVDYKKIKADPPKHPLDIYIIECWKENAVDVQNSIRVDHLQGLDIFQFVDLLKDKIHDHLLSQDYILQQHENEKMFEHWKNEKDEKDDSSSSASSEDYAAKVYKNSIFGQLSNAFGKRVEDIKNSFAPRVKVEIASEEILQALADQNLFDDGYSDTSSVDFDVNDKETYGAFSNSALKNALDMELKEIESELKVCEERVNAHMVKGLYKDLDRDINKLQEDNSIPKRDFTEVMKELDSDSVKDVESYSYNKAILGVNPNKAQVEAGRYSPPNFKHALNRFFIKDIDDDIEKTRLKIYVGGKEHIYMVVDKSSYLTSSEIRNYVLIKYGKPVLFNTDSFEVDRITIDGDDVCPGTYLNVKCESGPNDRPISLLSKVYARVKEALLFVRSWLGIKLLYAYISWRERGSIDMMRYWYNRFKSYFTHHKWEDPTLLMLKTVCTSAIAVAAFWAIYKQRRAEAVAEHVSEHFVKDLEGKVGSEPGVKRINVGKFGEEWNYKIHNRTPSSHTGDLESLYHKISSNVRKARWYYTNTDGVEINLRGFVLGIKEDFVLAPSHYFSKMPDIIDLEIQGRAHGLEGGSAMKIRLNRNDIKKVGIDIVVFRLLRSAFKDITTHLSVDVGAHNGEAYIRNQYVKAIYDESGVCVENDYAGTMYSLQPAFSYVSQLGKGDCGWPLIMYRDQGCAIVGIHVAGSHSGDKNISYSDIVYKNKILDACESLKGVFVQCLNVQEETLSSPVPIQMSDLGDPISKSVFHHEKLTYVDYFGKLPGPVLPRSKSKLIHSIFAHDEEFELTFYDIFGKVKTRYTKPLMQATHTKSGEYLSPVNNWYRKINRQTVGLDRKVMSKVIERFTVHILGGLADKGVTKLSPLPLSEAINGTEGDAFFHRINASTSGGFGYPGGKNKHLLLSEDGVTRVCSDELLQEIHDAINAFESGHTVNFVSNAALKDEPRDVEKVNKGKTRVFYVSPLSQLVLMRMFLGPFFSLMVAHSRTFMCSVGINMHREGAKMFEELSDFSPLFMEGDWGNYDLSTPPDIAVCVSSVICQTLEALGYNESAMKVVRGLLAEMTTPHVNFLGDIVRIFALFVSGANGTAERNCLSNACLFLYFWYSHPVLKNLDFFAYVKPNYYGDDALLAIKHEVSEHLNNVTFAKFAWEVFRMEYTTASKDTNFKKFLSITEVSFLKRQYSIHPDSNIAVAPIDKDTIYKMLYWCMPSDNVSMAEQMAMTVESALRESFFHLDRENYDRWRKVLYDIYEDKFGMSKQSLDRFVTYDSLYETYFNEQKTDSISPNTAAVESLSEIRPDINNRLDRRVSLNALNRALYEIKQQWFPDMIEELYAVLNDLYEEEKEYVSLVESLSNPLPGMRYADAQRTQEYMTVQEVRAATDKYHNTRDVLQAIQMTIENLKSALQRHKAVTRFHIQAGDVDAPKVGVVSPDKENKEENLIDISGEDVKTFDAGTYVDMMSSSEFSLESYLRRPVLIATSNIPLSADFDTTLDPWTLLLNNPTIRAKLRNYAFMRASLKIKVAISCSQFEYGTFMVGYVPKHDSNDISTFYLSSGSTYRYNKLQWLSQMKGSAIMRLHDNKPIELDIPYINYAPLLRLYNIDSSAIVSSINGVAAMGRLIIMSLNRPESVNSVAPTALSMNVYAHLENVDLGVSTGTQLIVSTEAGDEFETGPIERMSSALADISGKLESIPMIAPYAKASTIVFKAINMLASHFGFSVPTVNASDHMPQHIRPDAFQNAVVTTSSFMGKKMSFDPRQELSTDPRFMGETQDELTMSYIASRESLLDTFTLTVLSVPMQSIVWKTYVHPYANKADTAVGTSSRFIQPTALAFAARPFSYWRGTIKYKFVVNKTIFHKGKIAFMFEPNTAQYALVTTTLHLNKQYTVVMDLQETDTVEICIPFTYPRFWCRAPTETTSNTSVGSSFNVSRGQLALESMIGFLVVYPFTALQGPDSSPIDINVFVSSDDIQFNGYSPLYLPKKRASVEAANNHSTEPNSCYTLGEEVLDKSYKAHFHFGEQPTSFRSYLKRYTLKSKTVLFSSPSDPRTVTRTITRLFIAPNINALWGSTAMIDHDLDLKSYLAYSYLGWKGSLRMRACEQGILIRTGEPVIIALEPPEVENESTVAYSGQVPIMQNERPNALFMPNTNAGVEFEIPFYNNNLFLPSGFNRANWGSLSSVDPNFNNYFQKIYSVDIGTSDIAPLGTSLTVFYSVGEDFGLYHFLAACPYITTSW